MKKKQVSEKTEVPSVELLEKELKRTQYKKQYGRVLRSTIFILVTVAAIAVLVATLWLPVLQIYGHSMTPTLTDGDVVVSTKFSELETGEIIAFYYNNKILVKRAIAFSGDWVDIDNEGNIYVNGELLEEPYLNKKALGECDIDLPYQVPEDRVFVCGDHRATSIDSRTKAIGCVSEEQIVGTIKVKIWPLNEFEVY